VEEELPLYTCTHSYDSELPAGSAANQTRSYNELATLMYVTGIHSFIHSFTHSFIHSSIQSSCHPFITHVCFPLVSGMYSPKYVSIRVPVLAAGIPTVTCMLLLSARCLLRICHPCLIDSVL